MSELCEAFKNDVVLRDWQQTLNNVLTSYPTHTIYFVTDSIGNTGKTWFSGYYCETHERCVICYRPLSILDMSRYPVIFIDVPLASQKPSSWKLPVKYRNVSSCLFYEQTVFSLSFGFERC